MSDDLIKEFWIDDDDLAEGDGETPPDFLAELVADLPGDDDELFEDDGDEDSDDIFEDFLAEFMLTKDGFLRD